MRMKTALLVVLVALSVTAVYGYTTVGNRVYDPNGNPVLLRGICRPSLEWLSTGESIGEGDWRNMRDWGANVIRITLNQCFWAADANYGTFVDTQVNYIISLGLGVILDLHWSNKGSGSSCGQQNMPDNDSLTFWSVLAAKYKNNPWVIFELYNEPKDVSWSVWRNGGDAGGYQSPGFQKLLDTVRAAGASNAVIVNGLNWAYDLSGVPSNALSGSHIIYGTHPYDYGGKQPSDWPSGFGFLTTTYPIIATEFGDYDCSTNYYNNFISYANDHDISWTAWGWYPGGCGFPALINNWAGEPNAVGIVIKNALSGSKVPSGTVTSSTTTKAPSSTTKAPSTTPSSSSSTSAPTSSSSTAAPGTTAAASSACTFPTTSVNGCGVFVSACPVGPPFDAQNTQKYNIYVKNTGTLVLNSLTIVLSGGPTDSANNRWNIYPQGNGAYTVELWGGMPAGTFKTDNCGIVVTGNGVLVASASSYNCVSDPNQTPAPTTSTQTPSTSTTQTPSTTTTTTTTKAPTTTTSTSAPSTSTTTKAPTTTTSTSAPSTSTTTKAPTTTTTPTPTTTTTKAPSTTTTTTSSPSTTTTTTTKAPSTTQTPSTTQATSTTSAPSSGCAVSVSAFVKSSWVNGATYTQYGLLIQNSGTRRLKSLTLSLTSAVVTEAYNIYLVGGTSTQYSVDLWGGIEPGSLFNDQHGLQTTGPVVNSLVTAVASFDCY